MITPTLALTLLATLSPCTLAQEAEAPYPVSTALAEGVSPDTLGALSDLVRGFVDEDEIVGAELLVIVNGRSILHEAYGWADREAESPLEVGSVFCVRSMTKPVIGAAILMLIEDRELKLSDHVLEYLPSFDVEGSREITIEHLLTHTSGLPMSLIMGQSPRDLESIRAVAELGAGYELEFEPGSRFNYSDQGTDTLTAIVEVVTGAPAADFVRKRVLDPLGMQDSTCIMSEGHELRGRSLPKYAGSPGLWTRFWGPDEAALFPIFLGSQGLYSTLEDYAKFMDMWRKRGRVGKQRLLRSSSVRKALTPSPYPLGGPTSLPAARTDYGFLMQLWTGAVEDGEEDEREVIAFGHTGSDGTHAWVFPEQNALVLYFTQSRGTLTGLRVEELLGDLLLGVPFDANQAAPPFEEYLGYYREPVLDDLYRAIIRDGDELALEILGKAVVPLTYIGEDRWKLRPQPSTVIEFDRDEHGTVTGYHIGDHVELRFEPSPDLPSADELAERVAATHRLDLLESVGPLRIQSAIELPKLGLSGTETTLFAWPGQFRSDTYIGEEEEHLTYDGEQLVYSSSTQAASVLEGERARFLLEGNTLVRFGDWRDTYPLLQVIQRIKRGTKTVFIVRAGDTSAPAPSLYIDTETGRLIREDSLTFIPTLGRLGRRVSFGEFEDSSGILLPRRTEIELAHNLIGTITATITEIELGVELDENVFAQE